MGSSFLIIDAEPGIQVVSPGARVKLFCAVDDDYEYCKFISPQQRVCDFEWKRSEGNITMQTCDLDTDTKQVSFHGKYNDRESSMKELHTEDPDTRHLHEFFPNSDSFA